MSTKQSSIRVQQEERLDWVQVTPTFVVYLEQMVAEIKLVDSQEIMSIRTERHGNWTNEVNIMLMPGQNYGVVATMGLRRSSIKGLKCLEGTTA
ncbi:hypothetical protein Tco_0478882 [Tanacetum coccineum]